MTMGKYRNTVDRFMLETVSGTLNPQENRLCEAEGKKALFHKWVREEVPAKCIAMLGYDGEGFFRGVFALVEYSDGQCNLVRPKSIRFLDTELFLNGFVYMQTGKKE